MVNQIPWGQVAAWPPFCCIDWHSTYNIIRLATICWCMYCILSWYLFPIIFVYYSILLNILFCTHVKIGSPSDALYKAPVLGRQSTSARPPISQCIHTISLGWPLSFDVCIAYLVDIYFLSFLCTILPCSILYTVFHTCGDWQPVQHSFNAPVLGRQSTSAGPPIADVYIQYHWAGHYLLMYVLHT